MTSASELEAAGEDTEGLIEDAAKLYSTIKKLTATQSNPEGVSILTNTGDFKSTYEILLDISKVWGELNDKSQASLLETIAGKNRASVVSAILQAKDDNNNPLLESVYNASINSAGATADAMDIALSSIESAQKRMQNAWESAFQNSEIETAIADAYDFATALIKIVDNLGLIKSALGTISFAGFFKLFKSSDSFKSFENLGSTFKSIGKALSADSFVDFWNTRVAFISNSQKEIDKDIIEKYIAEKPGFTEEKNYLDFNQENSNASKILKQLISTKTDATKIEADYNEAINKTIGSMALSAVKTIGLNLAAGALSFAVSALATIIVTQLVTAISNYIHRNEIAISNAKDLTDQMREQKEEAESNAKTVESLKDRFEELSQGVADSGENLSLAAEDFSEYKDIVSQLVEMYPALIQGYSEENGYLVDKRNLLAEINELQADENRRNAITNSSDDNLQTLLKGSKATYDEAVKQYEEDVADLTSTFNNYVISKESFGINTMQFLADYFGVDPADYEGNNYDKAAAIMLENIDSILANYDDMMNQLEQEAESRGIILAEGFSDKFYGAVSQFYAKQKPKFDNSDMVKTLFEGVLATENVELSDYANRFANAIYEVLGSVNIDENSVSTMRVDIRNMLPDLSENSNFGKELQKYYQQLFKIEDMPYDQAASLVQSYAQFIAEAIEKYFGDLGIQISVEDILGNLDLSKYDGSYREAVVTSRNKQEQEIVDNYNRAITNASFSLGLIVDQDAIDAYNVYMADLEKIREYTANMTAEELRLWHEKTNGIVGYDAKVKAYEADTEQMTNKTHNFITANSSALETYQEKLSTIQGYFEKIADGSLQISDVTAAVKELDLDPNKIDFSTDDFEGFGELLKELANKQLQDFIDSLGDINEYDDPEAIQAWIDALKEEQTEALKAATANRELKNSMNDMADFASTMSSLQSAYDSLKDEDAISTTDWSSLVENFGDLPSFEDFIDSAAGAKSITKDVQDAFDRLVTEAIYMSDVMDNIIEQNGEYSESQKALLEAMLEEAGVTNSTAVANEILQQTLGGLILKKMSLGDETYSLTNLTEAQRVAVLNEIDALLQEGSYAEYTTQALAQLELIKISLNGTTITTSGEIDNLYRLAEQAGVAAEQMTLFAKAKAAAAVIEMGAVSWDNAEAVTKTMADFQNMLDSGFVFEKPEYFGGGSAVNANFGGSSSSGGGGSDSVNEIDWAARKIELLESKISSLAETAADTYEPWIRRNQALEDEIEATTELIGIQQDAYDEYMAKANEVELSDEYKKLVQEGGDIIETFEGTELYDAINEYQKYYDQAQECDDKIQDLIKSVKELNSQKLDNISNEFNDFINRTDAIMDLLDYDSYFNGNDNFEMKMDIINQRIEEGQSALEDYKKVITERLNQGVYGAESGTAMFGGYAVDTRALAENTDAATEALKTLGIAMNDTFGDIVSSNYKLGDITISFTPTLADGTVMTAETWEAYIKKITNNGEITDIKAILDADATGIEIDGNFISNAILSAIKSIPDDLSSAITRNTDNANFSGTAKDAISSLASAIAESFDSDNLKQYFGVEGVDLSEDIANLVLDTLSSAMNAEDVESGTDVQSVFDSSMSDILSALFLSMQAMIVNYYKKNGYDMSGLTFLSKSEGYAEQYSSDLQKMASMSSQVMDDMEKEFDVIKNQYSYELDAISSALSLASTENKGKIGGGVSLNEQISLLEQQKDIQKKIYEAILMNIMAKADPESDLYKKASNALSEIQNQVEDTSAQIVQLILDDFNRVVQAYDNAMGLLEHRETMINLNMELADLQGYMASGVWYEYLIKNAEEELALLQQEKQVLQEKLDAAVDSGYVEVYSEAWYEMQNQINQVDEEILQTTIDIQKFKNEIRQIEWDRFDFLQEKINTLNDEFEFLIKLISNSEDLIDDYGNFTDYGWTSISLYQKQFETYAKLVSNYREEIAKLDKDFESDPLNKDYVERRQELLETEREYILSQQEAKNAIIDLIQDAYDQQLEKLQEIIDKKKESLQAEKDIYDYQRKVQDQTKNIADIQKQLAAYTNDTSEESKKTIQELKVDLKDAMQNLQDSEYDRYVSDQEKMLDRLYEDYEDWIDMRMDDTDALIEDVLAQLDEKGAVVEECLTEIAGTWNYDRMITSVESIEEMVRKMFERADANASEKSQEVWDNTITQPLDTIYNGETIQSIVDKAGGGSSSGSVSSSSNSASSPSSSSSGPPDDDWYKYNHSSPSVFSPQYKNSNGDDYSTYGIGTAEYEKLVLTAASNGYNLADDKDKFGDTEWYQAAEEILKKNQSSYSTGGPLGKAIKASGEDGIFFGRLGEEIVTPDELDKLSDIFEQVDLMKNIRGKYNFPASMVQNSTSMGDVKFEITLPNVQNYEDFRRQLVRDPNFEKATLTMVNNAVVGKNSLAKLKYS